MIPTYPERCSGIPVKLPEGGEGAGLMSRMARRKGTWQRRDFPEAAQA